jgi:hypothetical protein
MANFPEYPSADILMILDAYGAESYERERERVQLAIVKLSEGDVEKLREYTAAAKLDYRDVLFWTENPREAAVDTLAAEKEVSDLLDWLEGKSTGDVTK